MHQLLLNCVNRSSFENKNSFKLERMRSENTPAAPYLSILLIYTECQVKTRQSQNYNLKECQKLISWNIAKIFTCDTPSEVAW